MICPTCATPMSRDVIGAGDRRREVWCCSACWTVAPVRRHLELVRDRRDLS